MLFLRFTTMNLSMLAATAAILAGGAWTVAGLPVALLFLAAIDERLGDTRRSFSKAKAAVLNGQLYLTLPLIALLSMSLATLLSDGDPFGLIWLIDRLTGSDAAARRAATHPALRAAAILPVGLFVGAAGINVAHELFHRLHAPLDATIGRWLLAFACDTTFAIEHVHGHHRHVATLADPATARRGESYYAFLVRSSLGEIFNGFRFEANRLKNRRLPVLSRHNKAIRGQFMSLAIAAGYGYAAGWRGLAAFLGAALIGKAYLEATNYIEHYGLVRAAGRRVEPRHSWDCYRKASNVLLYNLPRHSDHHLNAHKPFWDLKALPQEAPLLPYGYQAMVAIALAPRRFFKLMAPRLKAWDETMASAEERAIISGHAPQVVGDGASLRPAAR